MHYQIVPDNRDRVHRIFFEEFNSRAGDTKVVIISEVSVTVWVLGLILVKICGLNVDK